MQKSEDITDGMKIKLKELEDKVERQIRSLAQHVDRLVGEITAKLDSLAETTFKNETDFEELLADRQVVTATETAKPENNTDNKFAKADVDKIKALVAKLDEKTDEKLQGFVTMWTENVVSLTNGLIEGTLGALAANTGKRFQAIEERLARDAKDDG